MFHFAKHRKIFYILSIIIMIPGLISLFVQGLNLGIDFKSGSIFEVRFDSPVQVERIREVVANQGMDSSRIQKSGDRDFLIRLDTIDEQQGQELTDAFTEQIGNNQVLRNEFVDPIVGKELVYKALGALAVASVIMVVYITIRFEFKQGIAAIVALLHDVLLVVGIFSIFRLEVDGSFIAAILTIIGYSINDTIIIFDRIRENMHHKKKEQTLEDLVNASIWQTLTRSINTVLTVMFVLGALFLLGGVTTKVFVLAMLIGVSVGAYSSIFIASPLWLDLKISEKKGHRSVAKA